MTFARCSKDSGRHAGVTADKVAAGHFSNLASAGSREDCKLGNIRYNNF